MLNPYVGPKPFQKEELDVFFGRDLEALDIISLIIGHQVVVVYSQSGAGKTSLLNTKIIRGLEKEDFNVLPIIRLNQGYVFHKHNVECVYSFNTVLQLQPNKDENNTIYKSLSEFFDKRYCPQGSGAKNPEDVLIFD